MSDGAAGVFDVRAYVRDPWDVRPADVDLSGMAGIDAASCDGLLQLWSVEHDVLDLMRDLLVTPTHAESRVTAFLTTWAYEQFWLAQTLAAAVEAAGGVAKKPRTTLLGRIRSSIDERTVPTIGAFRTNLLGSDLVAGHMVTGWLSTAAADLVLARLAELEPRLAPLHEAMHPVKVRHMDFYADEARQRLSAGRGPQRLALSAASRWEWPGVRYRGRAAVRGQLVRLFADPVVAPRVRALDGAVAAWPGLSSVRPLRSALGRMVR